MTTTRKRKGESSQRQYGGSRGVIFHLKFAKEIKIEETKGNGSRRKRETSSIKANSFPCCASFTKIHISSIEWIALQAKVPHQGRNKQHRQPCARKLAYSTSQQHGKMQLKPKQHGELISCVGL
jgi:hypothetical protein